MFDDEILLLEKKLDALREKHRILDSEIQTLSENRYADQLQLMRFKKEKLTIRDQIVAIEDMLYPDIPA